MNTMELPAQDLPDNRIRAEIGKLMAETVKLNAEAAKFRREHFWQPYVVILTAMGAGAAIFAGLGKLFGFIG